MRRYALALAMALAVRQAAAQSSAEELSRFSAVLGHIRANYVDSVTYRQLVHSAIDGMLRGLDPHSWYLTTEDNAWFNALERGELAVIGVSLELADGVPTILAVSDRSPADRVGIRPGDRLLSIDGTPTVGLNARTIALRLAGEKGSRVKLLIERGSRLEPDSITVIAKREAPPRESFVHGVLMLDATTGYVRLDQFGEKSADDVRDAIKKLKGQHANRIVLDIRGNPGGIVTEAVDLASEFLPANSLVFSTRGRQISVNQVYRTKNDGDFQNLPLVLLVDQGSASASEALAGSLQDNDRAVIAGRRTFGKALMQTGFQVPDGFVMLTIGHVIAPSGRYIQRPYTGLQLQQYYAFAGDSSWQDTTRVFKTLHGRPVKGGGGIAPDVSLPAPPALPRWVTIAIDSGWDQAVADSVASALASDAPHRTAWFTDSAAWKSSLLNPFLDRSRKRLGITGELTPVLSSLLARKLASEAATVRWDEETGKELMIRSDADVVAAIGLFARVPVILKH